MHSVHARIQVSRLIWFYGNACGGLCCCCYFCYRNTHGIFRLIYVLHYLNRQHITTLFGKRTMTTQHMTESTIIEKHLLHDTAKFAILHKYPAFAIGSITQIFSVFSFLPSFSLLLSAARGKRPEKSPVSFRNLPKIQTYND